MELGFEKADSHLPRIDVEMVHVLSSTHPDFLLCESRNVKMERATEVSYGDNAVGFVQLKRKGSTCIIKGKVTPQHKVGKKAYSVIATVHEEEEKILECICTDCIASEGGCKHAVAFLFWLHRRSEEQSVTEVENYWKATPLSKAGRSMKYMDLSTLVGKPIPPLQSNDDSFIEQFKSNIKNQVGGIFDVLTKPKFLDTSIHQLSISFKQEVAPANRDISSFLSYISLKMTDSLCSKIERDTQEQSKSHSWHEHRYGRITASKIYEASKCNTYDFSLVETIMGATTPLETVAIKMGKMLEGEVVRIVGEKCNLKLKKCGLFLCSEYPVFGASPAAVTETSVIGVKCPYKDKTISNYVLDGIIKPKYMAQIQIQMYLAKKQTGFFALQIQLLKILKMYSYITCLWIRICAIAYSMMLSIFGKMLFSQF